MNTAADLPDLNVWLALACPGHSHHHPAVHYWEQQSAEQVLFCTVTALGLAVGAARNAGMSDQTLITADDRIFVAGHRGMAVALRRKQLWVPVGFAHGSSPGGGDHLAAGSPRGRGAGGSRLSSAMATCSILISRNTTDADAQSAPPRGIHRRGVSRASALTMALSPPQPNQSSLEASRSLASGVLLKDLSDLASDLWKELVSHPDLLQIDLIVGMNQNVAHSCHGTSGYLCVLDSNLPAQSPGGFSEYF